MIAVGNFREVFLSAFVCMCKCRCREVFEGKYCKLKLYYQTLAFDLNHRCQKCELNSNWTSTRRFNGGFFTFDFSLSLPRSDVTLTNRGKTLEIYTCSLQYIWISMGFPTCPLSVYAQIDCGIGICYIGYFLCCFVKSVLSYDFLANFSLLFSWAALLLCFQ